MPVSLAGSERASSIEALVQRFAAALLLPLWIGATPIAAVTLDFEDFRHGEVVTRVTADNFNRGFDYAVAFDTNASGSEDPDLERGSGWSGGNLAPSADLGNILILQENDTGCATGTCSSPDDEGERPSGTFAFRLGNGEVATSVSFDLIDVEAIEGAATREGGSITFFLAVIVPLVVGPPPTITFSFADFLSLGQGVEYGDRSANHIELALDQPFNAFQIRMGGSGGIDNIVTDGTPVPEPDAAALLGLGLSALAIARRLRHR